MSLMPADGKSISSGVDLIEHNQLKEKNRSLQTKLLDHVEKVEELKGENETLQAHKIRLEQELEEVTKQRDLHLKSSQQQ